MQRDEFPASDPAAEFEAFEPDPDELVPDGPSGFSRRRFGVFVGELAVGASAMFGALTGFKPTERAFAQLTVPAGLCLPMFFVSGPSCSSGCSTVSCCPFQDVGGTNEVCCTPDIISDKAGGFYSMEFSGTEPPFLCPPDCAVFACCIVCV
jgi:hypothetical protein